MRGLTGLTLAVAVALYTAPALAAGDPAQGRATAERWCATCHVVSQGGRGADTAPNFAAIARIRSDDYLRGFLMQPHPPMPRFEISRPDIDDLVAYFATLRQ